MLDLIKAIEKPGGLEGIRSQGGISEQLACYGVYTYSCLYICSVDHDRNRAGENEFERLGMTWLREVRKRN